MLAAAAVAAIAGILVAVLLLSRGGHSATSAAASTAAEVPSSVATTPAPTSAEEVSGSSVEQVLSEYQDAYSSEDASALRELFSQGLVRKDGSNPPEDLGEAIATYEKQFSELTEPDYTLQNVAIEPGDGEASAAGTYSITSRNGTVEGAIQFHLVDQEEELVIDSITVTPAK